MFGLGPATKVYLAAGATDLRKGFDGLYGLARDALRLDPLSGPLVGDLSSLLPLSRKRLTAVA
jgi:IS66 Orf2 like protein